MIIAICIAAVLVTIILGLVTIVCVSLFSTAKYGHSHRIDELEAFVESWNAQKKLDPKDVNDRLIALENRAGVMIGGRR